MGTSNDTGDTSKAPGVGKRNHSTQYFPVKWWIFLKRVISLTRYLKYRITKQQTENVGPEALAVKDIRLDTTYQRIQSLVDEEGVVGSRRG